MVLMIRELIRPYYLKLKMWYPTYLIKKNVTSYQMVMDIGSGKNHQQFVDAAITICVDPTYDTTDQDIIKGEILESGIHRIKGDWNLAIKIMKQEYVDAVFLIDVIEHLEKYRALPLLKETESLVKKHIVIFTPYGYMPQEDGEWNSHRSGWTEADFGDGWKTWVFKDFHTVDFKNNKLQEPVSALLAIYSK